MSQTFCTSWFDDFWEWQVAERWSDIFFVDENITRLDT